MTDTKTKKRDIIRQKNKLKVFTDFRFLRYARYASVIVPVLVIGLLFMTTGMRTDSLEQMISEQPVITVGFVVCVVNLLIWYQSGSLLENLNIPQHVEAARVQYIIMAIAQLAMFNYVSFLLIAVGLWRYFRWDQITVKTVFADIKKDGQMKNTIMVFLTLLILCALGLFLFSIFQSI